MKPSNARTFQLVIAVLCLAALAAALPGCGSRTAGDQPATAPDAAVDQAAPGLGIADPAKREACYATERAVEAQAAAWTVQNGGAEPPSSVGAMVAAGVIRSVPKCPAGGTYTFDNVSGMLICSVHAHF